MGDTEPFELLDQARLGISRRRLSEMLRGGYRLDRNILALLDHRPPLLLFERFSFLGLARFLVETLIAVELDDAAGCSEQESVEIEVNGRRVEDRRRHLRRHEPLPDQLVQLVLVFLEILPDVLWAARRIRRTDGLVRILRVL